MVAAIRHHLLSTLLPATLAGLCVFCPAALHASAVPQQPQLDVLALIELEHHIDAADQREQCYLYAEVLHSLTELAGRQIAANQLQDASYTLIQINNVAQKVQAASAGNVKRLKGVEQLLDRTAHRFEDVVRATSADDRVVMQRTMQRLNALHTEVLTKVFSR